MTRQDTLPGRLHLGVWLALAVVAVATQTPARGQPALLPPLTKAVAAPPTLPDPRADGGGGEGKKGPAGPEILPVSYPGGLPPAIPVTLPEVLKLAVLANLDIAQANLIVERAQVAVLRARAQFLPDITTGVQHLGHDGTIQRTEGTIIRTNRDSLFVGGGPALALDGSSAIFGPAQARALLDAARHGKDRVTLETLVRVADVYFAVLRARRQLARLDEVLDMLTSEEESELRGKSKGLLPLIKSFVKTGTALPSDQARVEADVVRRHGERVRALEEIRVASAELSRLLHLNSTYLLLPVEDHRLPVQIPGDAWMRAPLDGLVGQALGTRPELAESQALIDAAVLRYRQARWQPLLPSLQAGLSFGGFGGGPELKQDAQGRESLGHSGNIKDFDVRTDLSVALVWRLENMGLGNRARIRDAQIVAQQAEVQRLFQQDLVVTQVVQALEGVQRGEARYNIYRAGLFDDEGRAAGAVYRSLRLNFVRIRGGQGLPLEVLDSTRRLSDVLQGYADSVSDFDRSRLRLLLALGMPPVALLDPACMPQPPATPPAGPVIEIVPAGTPARPSTDGRASGGPGVRPAAGVAATPAPTVIQAGHRPGAVPLPPIGGTEPPVRRVPWR